MSAITMRRAMFTSAVVMMSIDVSLGKRFLATAPAQVVPAKPPAHAHDDEHEVPVLMHPSLTLEINRQEFTGDVFSAVVKSAREEAAAEARDQAEARNIKSFMASSYPLAQKVATIPNVGQPDALNLKVELSPASAVSYRSEPQVVGVPQNDGSSDEQIDAVYEANWTQTTTYHGCWIIIVTINSNKRGTIVHELARGAVIEFKDDTGRYGPRSPFHRKEAGSRDHMVKTLEFDEQLLSNTDPNRMFAYASGAVESDLSFFTSKLKNFHVVVSPKPLVAPPTASEFVQWLQVGLLKASIYNVLKIVITGVFLAAGLDFINPELFEALLEYCIEFAFRVVPDKINGAMQNFLESFWGKGDKHHEQLPAPHQSLSPVSTVATLSDLAVNAEHINTSEGRAEMKRKAKAESDGAVAVVHNFNAIVKSAKVEAGSDKARAEKAELVVEGMGTTDLKIDANQISEVAKDSKLKKMQATVDQLIEEKCTGERLANFLRWFFPEAAAIAFTIFVTPILVGLFHFGGLVLACILKWLLKAALKEIGMQISFGWGFETNKHHVIHEEEMEGESPSDAGRFYVTEGLKEIGSDVMTPVLFSEMTEEAEEHAAHAGAHASEFLHTIAGQLIF